MNTIFVSTKVSCGIALKVMVHTILVSTKVSCGWCYHEGNSEHYISIDESIMWMVLPSR